MCSAFISLWLPSSPSKAARWCFLFSPPSGKTLNAAIRALTTIQFDIIKNHALKPRAFLGFHFPPRTISTPVPPFSRPCSGVVFFVGVMPLPLCGASGRAPETGGRPPYCWAVLLIPCGRANPSNTRSGKAVSFLPEVLVKYRHAKMRGYLRIVCFFCRSSSRDPRASWCRFNSTSNSCGLCGV